MRIIFDVRDVGLGNNGGSLTLVRSANVLSRLGHQVTFIDNGRNQHTWTKLECDFIKCEKESQVPDSDFVIATGFRSVLKTVRLPKRCGIKLHWIRGWEVWQGSESWIRDVILEAKTIKLVNSIGLKKKLKSYGIKSHLVYPGYDIEDLYPLGIREDSVFILGGLYVTGKHVKTKRPNWVINIYRILKQKYPNKIKLWMFGSSKFGPTEADYYISNPSMKEKNYFYNNIHVWLSPSKLEGLHMPPAEAMLAEVPVVGVNEQLCGTRDYLHHGITGFVADRFSDFVSFVEKLYRDIFLRIKLGKKARKKILQIGDRKTNMQKLVSLLESLV